MRIVRLEEKGLLWPCGGNFGALWRDADRKKRYSVRKWECAAYSENTRCEGAERERRSEDGGIIIRRGL